MKVIFVCRDNKTRSVIAHYCFQDYLEKNNIKNIKVSSAGTNPQKFENPILSHVDSLKKLGIDASKHKSKVFNKKMVTSYDVIIVMDKKNQEYLKEHYNIDSILFYELSIGKKKSINLDWTKPRKHIEKQIDNLVKKTCKLMPMFYKKLKKVGV